MTKVKLFERYRNLLVLDRRDPHAFDGICEMCNVIDELRPYGPNNESICYTCAMKDEATTARKFREMMEGQQ